MGYLKITRCGDKYWYNDEEKWHREDGPAIIWNNGNRFWYINGKLHREDGPAIECNDDQKYWYYNHEFIGESRSGFTQEDFDRYLKIKEYW